MKRNIKICLSYNYRSFRKSRQKINNENRTKTRTFLVGHLLYIVIRPYVRLSLPFVLGLMCQTVLIYHLSCHHLLVLSF